MLNESCINITQHGNSTSEWEIVYGIHLLYFRLIAYKGPLAVKNYFCVSPCRLGVGHSRSLPVPAEKHVQQCDCRGNDWATQPTAADVRCYVYQ